MHACNNSSVKEMHFCDLYGGVFSLILAHIFEKYFILFGRLQSAF